MASGSTSTAWQRFRILHIYLLLETWTFVCVNKSWASIFANLYTYTYMVHVPTPPFYTHTHMCNYKPGFLDGAGAVAVQYGGWGDKYVTIIIAISPPPHASRPHRHRHRLIICTSFTPTNPDWPKSPTTPAPWCPWCHAICFEIKKVSHWALLDFSLFPLPWFTC